MTELSLFILDIACNSQTAKAKKITILLNINTLKDTATIKIEDDGTGMTQEQIEHALGKLPKAEGRGNGIPLFKRLCVNCGGNLEIFGGKNNKGIVIKAKLRLSSPSRPPLGDMGSTIAALCSAKGDVVLEYKLNGNEYIFKKDKQQPEIAQLGRIKQTINENIQKINGGYFI